MAAEDLLNRKLGNYFIEAVLGSGGMATVYRAIAPSGEAVALKVLSPPPGVGPEMLARFEREARTAAHLSHPAIVPVLDVGHADNYTFMVMQLIEGQTLAERLLDAEAERLEEKLAADIAWQIADALHYAHTQNVVHRDVKPSNIMLTAENQALLTDFGVALALDDPVLTQTGYIVGTPAYIAPEQAAGKKPIDGRADLYSLGVVLYQMLTGHIPFQGSTPQVLHAHVYDPPPSPSAMVKLSVAMETLVLQALAKDATRRFQSGLDLAQALATLGQQAGTKTHLSLSDTKTYLTVTPAKPTATEPSYTTPHLQRPTTVNENPFFYGGAIAPEQFYGRRDILNLLVQRLKAAQSVSIVGERRMGKSSLLNYFRASAPEYFSSNVIVVYLDLMKAYSRTRLGLMKALRRALTRLWHEPWPANEDGDLMAFDFALEELQAAGLRLLLCLDEVENLTQQAAEFNDVLEDWRASAQMGQMAILTASAQPLADLCASGGLTSPFYNIFSQHRLGLLARQEWQALVMDNMNVTAEDLTFIERVAGGHPFFTQMTASYLWETRRQGRVDHNQLYQELWFQLEPHLRHLWRSLTAEEQTTLYELVDQTAPPPQPRVVAALERRGITTPQQQPFSALFGEMIASRHVAG